MSNHLQFHHQGHRRYINRKSDYDVMEFMCRVCNWREDTMQEVEEHAKTHTANEPLFTKTYREKSKELNRFRSDRSRSRSPRSKEKQPRLERNEEKRMRKY